MTVWKLVACAAGAGIVGVVVDAAGRRACPPCVAVPCPPDAACPLPPAPEPTDAPGQPVMRVDQPPGLRPF